MFHDLFDSQVHAVRAYLDDRFCEWGEVCEPVVLVAGGGHSQGEKRLVAADAQG